MEDLLSSEATGRKYGPATVASVRVGPSFKRVETGSTFVCAAMDETEEVGSGDGKRQAIHGSILDESDGGGREPHGLTGAMHAQGDLDLLPTGIRNHCETRHALVLSQEAPPAQLGDSRQRRGVSTSGPSNVAWNESPSATSSGRIIERCFGIYCTEACVGEHDFADPLRSFSRLAATQAVSAKIEV